MADQKIGVVTHYYDQIGVAVVELISPLKRGDHVSVCGSADFSQEITSIQVNHESIDRANKGDVVGIKVDQAVKKGDELILKEKG